tara:strand:+ start:39 stop:242 length:204 start_codon:yes stop_codon:yes gene_type:complete
MSWKSIIKDDRDLFGSEEIDNAELVYDFEKIIIQMDRLMDAYSSYFDITVKNSWENFKNLLRREGRK